MTVDHGAHHTAPGAVARARGVQGLLHAGAASAEGRETGQVWTAGTAQQEQGRHETKGAQVLRTRRWQPYGHRGEEGLVVVVIETLAPKDSIKTQDSMLDGDYFVGGGTIVTSMFVAHTKSNSRRRWWLSKF